MRANACLELMPASEVASVLCVHKNTLQHWRAARCATRSVNSAAFL
jgi:hypothetical protein